jgi:hypothetical protein
MTTEEHNRWVAQEMDNLIDQSIQRGGLIGLFEALDRWLFTRINDAGNTRSRYKAMRILIQALRRVLLEV